ncbi:hypothetical protein D3C76_1782620 [compost metagenome]
MQLVAQVITGHRADVGVVLQRVADFELAGRLDEFAGELINDAVFDDQALGRGADLAGVLITADHRGFDGSIEVGVGQHDERV